MRHDWPQIGRIGHAFLRDRPGCPRMAVGGQRHNIPAPRFITRDQAHAVGKTIAVDHHDPPPSVYRYAAPVAAATVAGQNTSWTIEAGRGERPSQPAAPDGQGAPPLANRRPTT